MDKDQKLAFLNTLTKEAFKAENIQMLIMVCGVKSITLQIIFIHSMG
jgi:hypothetical protein